MVNLLLAFSRLAESTRSAPQRKQKKRTESSSAEAAATTKASDSTTNPYPDDKSLNNCDNDSTNTANDGQRMMSPKRMILLLIFYISYLMFGASIYYHIEHGLEYHRRQEELKERIAINEYILEQLDDKNVTTQNEVLERISDYCGKPVTDYRNDEYEIPYTWTFYHSFFFAFTVCSTVGYGNISPTTTLGRMIMIVYSVIGIPINGILFAGLGEYFGKTFSAIYRRYKKYKMSRDVHYVPPQLGLITTILIALVPGITLFLLLPSWVFSYFEDWPYSLALYYSYVTTTTIGFGDYVPTFQPQQPREFGGWFVVYEIFIIIWFIFSLGYLLMIMTFITRGLQSKKLARLEQQLSSNIKATQHRIWSGVTKDVGYLRRILNELYILKFKPVYTESAEYEYSLHRSASCPELTMYRVDPVPVPSRKRAFSECYDAVEARGDDSLFTVHASSDTELNRIDRQKSFETAEAFRQTTGLLAKVVTALATVQPPPQDEDTTVGAASMYGGYHGFSDSQILASEWSFPGTNEIPKPRGRACSDFNLDPKWKGGRRSTMPAHQEWTWSGDNDQIQEAINSRCRQMDRERENIYRSSLGLPTLDHVVNVDEDDFNRKPQTASGRAKKFSIPDGFRRLFPFKKRPSQADWSVVEGEKGDKRKFSVASVPEGIPHNVPTLDYYSTVTANASPTYFRNGKPLQTSNGSLNTRLSVLGLNNINENPRPELSQLTELNNGSSITTNTSYQRNPQAQGDRRRKVSAFTQNPALSNRRGSMFPPTSAAAALSQRRASVFNPERRGSNVSVAGFNPPPRRGSLFPLAANANRRPSLFSTASQEDVEILENTTLADLIRALEMVHTQAVLDEQVEASALANKSGGGGLSNMFRSDKKKRKASAAVLDDSPLPPILSLFGNDSKTLNAAAANRLYARRSTIVGTLPQTSHQLNQTSITPSNASNILTRRRQSTVQIKDPPPSYSERDGQSSVTSTPSTQTKFKRRFSVRPTALQIPPGMAPPPGVNINTVVSQMPMGGPSTSAGAMSSLGPPSQTVLQRRLSLRPSPLAQPTITTTSPDGSTTTTNPLPSASSSTARLLPARPSNTSTHSPLSRIVQISQAQRKSSMPDGFSTQKPDK
uniref:Potassium channel domain-containing protein n=1 Tax=Musca domestica TaxID=7370 RepID=A0A1I8MGE2_MUSDO